MSNELALPERPNLDQLRKQAREYQQSHPGLTLTEAKRDLARQYGFPSWTKLKHHVELLLGLRTHVEAFVEAALGGRLNEADTLLAAHPDLGRSPVVALMTGEWVNVDVAKSIGPREWVPILYVCYSRYYQRPENATRLVQLAKALLEKGADANASYIDTTYPELPETCLYAATGVNNNTDLTRLLLEHGANPNDGEAFYHGTEHANTEPLRLILEAGGNPKGTNCVARMLDFDNLVGLELILKHYGEPDDYLREVLHHAIIRGRSVEHLKLLVAYGADPNRKREGLTPYVRARLLGERESADYLESIGVDMTMTPAERTVVSYVEGDDSVETVEVPIHLQWPLSDAARKGNLDGLRRMLAAGFDLNIEAGWGRTGLHQAAWGGQVEAAKLLIEHGADISARDPHHQGTPAGWALVGARVDPSPTGDYPAILRLLFEAGGDKLVNPKWVYEMTEMLPELRKVVEEFIPNPVE